MIDACLCPLARNDCPRHPTERKQPPLEVRCRECNGWLLTVPPGTTWARGRCGNRRCKLYNEGQTVHLKRRVA